MKKTIITIAGSPGSGKSSTAKGVAKRLGYGHFSSGDLCRKIAGDKGLSIEEFNFAAEKRKELDFEVDALLRSMGQEKRDLVIDSRTAFHWIPDAFKVYLKLDPRIGAERVFAQIKNSGRISQMGSSVDEVYEITEKRMESEYKRFRELYGIDITDRANYDLVVDTMAHGLEAVIEKVASEYEQWLHDQD
jgi:cytidylate kinase